ncbi:EF-hand domain-containing protein [Streptomyces clavuligerus]|nr:EF-hand domain-containing protein [Streptomyces clavuligerus]MBY6307380.1 EF-hand domain-containing protein [Streptomyces clavuligerus]QCS10057.1 calcium-binding protein [Streptomyces clavuligerus]QPJ97899.1 calcium-binding protein [Streptomyces clavuligerus]WDN56763.1 EF-hand domain-containing protein [Streptomyces clavuligerus]
MSTEVKHRKFNKLFDWFDQSHDGLLTRADFRAMSGLFSALAPEGDQENVSAFEEAFDKWWQLLVAHTGVQEDGEVTRQEFFGVMETGVTSPEPFEDTVMAIVNALMRTLDTNGDGVLSQDEYVRMYDALGIPPEHSGAAFRLLDRDGDGSISHEEFRLAIHEFYLSTDENAPGNWLIGPFDQPA